MQIPNSITPGAINILQALGTEEEMEAFINQFIAASDIYNAKADKASGIGDHEDMAAPGSSN